MLIAITDKTWYQAGANNLGLIATGDGGAIVVDTGLDRETGRLLRKALDSLGLTLHVVINTHHHADHIGGNAYLARAFPAATFYAPPLEAALIAHPLLEPTYLAMGASPPKGLRTRWLLAPQGPAPTPIGNLEQIQTWQSETIKIAGLPLTIVGLAGHSPAQIGVVYDGVCFAADGFFGSALLIKHGIPYAQIIAGQLASLKALGQVPAEYFLPGHGPLTKRAELAAVLGENRTAIERSSSLILASLGEPATLDEITGAVLQSLAADGHSGVAGIAQYAIFAAAVAAHLTYLEEQAMVQANLSPTGVRWSRMG